MISAIIGFLGGRTASLAILFALVAVGFGGWQWWQKNDAEKQLQDARIDHAAVVLAATQGKNVALERARVAERQKSLAIQQISDQLSQEKQDAIETRERLIADLRAGQLRLRERFKCPANTSDSGVSGSRPTTGSGDDSSRIGLRRSDQEFLIRIAAEADEIAAQLQACQNVIRSDRK